MRDKYVVVSGAIFGLIAVVHAARALYQWPVLVAGEDIPLWVSWLAVVISGGLCAWAFRSSRP